MVAVRMGRLVRTGRGEVGLGPASPCVRAGRTYASLRTLLRGLMGGPSWVRKARSWVRVRSELRAGPRPAHQLGPGDYCAVPERLEHDGAVHDPSLTHLGESRGQACLEVTVACPVFSRATEAFVVVRLVVPEELAGRGPGATGRRRFSPGCKRPLLAPYRALYAVVTV